MAMGQDSEHGDALSLNERIAQLEDRLARDRTRAAVEARIFGLRARRRVTSPTALLLAGGIGFVSGEILRSRKVARKMAKRMHRKEVSGQSTSLLSSITSVLRTAWLAPSGILLGRLGGSGSRDNGSNAVAGM